MEVETAWDQGHPIIVCFGGTAAADYPLILIIGRERQHLIASVSTAILVAGSETTDSTDTAAASFPLYSRQEQAATRPP
jgi:transcriptional regulator GlxA family with amidase domain